jgi:ribulose-5-phosphate 4-epimerase/fuculose-1-phosphate aldolase
MPLADCDAYNHRRSGTAGEYAKEMAMPGSDEVAEKLPPLLQNYKAAMVRGHGSFAVGQMLEEAFQWTSNVEASCKTLYLHRLLSPRDIKEGEGKW